MSLIDSFGSHDLWLLLTVWHASVRSPRVSCFWPQKEYWEIKCIICVDVSLSVILWVSFTGGACNRNVMEKIQTNIMMTFLIKGKFAVVPNDKICGRNLLSKIPVDMNSKFMKLCVTWPTRPKGHIPQKLEFSKWFL